jgi:hypothetical protein
MHLSTSKRTKRRTQASAPEGATISKVLSTLEELPVELLLAVCVLSGPKALLALNATCKSLREPVDLAWGVVSEPAFGQLQFTFNQSRWWFRSLFKGDGRGEKSEEEPGSSSLVSLVPSPSGKRKSLSEESGFLGPNKYEQYLTMQLHSRLFRGSSCGRSKGAKTAEVSHGSLRPRLDQILGNDEVRYFNLSFSFKMVESLFVEITVDKNHDNLSLSLVDFSEGGVCSVTFSPDAGAIIKERKVKDRPRQVLGSFHYALETMEPQETRGTRFFGKVGLFVSNGKLAFLRLPKGKAVWQSTGLCVQLADEFDKAMLTPCIAFRDSGEYGVEITKVAKEPPVEVTVNEPAIKKGSTLWQPITWSHADQ